MIEKLLLNLPDILKAKQITYQWDSFDPYIQLGDINALTEATLMKISYRARLAYATSCLEWVVFYLSDLYSKEELRPFQYVKSFWDVQISFDPKNNLEMDTPSPTEENDWQGPVLAATDMSIVTVINAFYSVHDIENTSKGTVDASFAELIPLYLLSPEIKKHFIHWRIDTLKRLEQSFPYSEENSWGDKITREFMYKILNKSNQINYPK